MTFILLFTICTIVNVIINTSKSLITINGSKIPASAINALSAGFYTYIVVLTTGDGISTIWKMVITAVCNFLGVYIVKLIQEKNRPTKLWKIEATLKPPNAVVAINQLEARSIPYNYVDIQKYVLVNCYCATKEESKVVRQILKEQDAKYFIGENKEKY